MCLTNVWTNRGKRAAEATRPDGNLDDLDEQSPRGWPAGDTHASRGFADDRSGGCAVAKAVPGLGVGALAEREDLHRCDAEDEALAAIGIAEPLAGDLEIPVELGLPHRRQPLELRGVGHAGGDSLDHDVEPRPEMAGAGGEDAAKIGLQFLPFLPMRAGAEVKRPVKPYRRERRDVRPPVATYRGQPEHIRLPPHIVHLVP